MQPQLQGGQPELRDFFHEQREQYRALVFENREYQRMLEETVGREWLHRREEALAGERQEWGELLTGEHQEWGKSLMGERQEWQEWLQQVLVIVVSVVLVLSLSYLKNCIVLYSK